MFVAPPSCFCSLRFVPHLFFSHSCVRFPLFFFSFFFKFTQLPPPFPPGLLLLYPSLCPSGKLCLPCHSPCTLILCGFSADSGVGFEGEGLVLDLQSLLIMLSSFKQPADNRQSPSKTPATHNVNIGILLLVSMENAI